MSEYGSVRQYRNRVTRMRGNLESTTAAVRCAGCVGKRYCCAACEPKLREWVTRVLRCDPAWMRVKAGCPAEAVVR